MSKLALHFYLHTPLGTSESLFKSTVDNLYSPLIKLFKNTKDFKFSFSISVATLEQLDNFGYKHLLGDLKHLVGEGIAELVICPAYNSSKNLIGMDFFQRQLILNEYALGYYFGLKQSFEGDPAILIKDVSGVYLPNDILDMELKTLSDDLGYKWVKDSTKLNSSSSSDLIALDDNFAYLREDKKLADPVINYLVSGDSSDLNFSFSSEFEYNFATLSVFELFSQNPNFIYKLSKLLDYFKSNNVIYYTTTSIYSEAVDETKYSVLDLDDNLGDIPNNSMFSSEDCLGEMLLIDSQNYVKKAVSDVTIGYENSPIWLLNTQESLQDTLIPEFMSLSKLSDTLISRCIRKDLSPYYLDLIAKLPENSQLKSFLASI